MSMSKPHITIDQYGEYIMRLAKEGKDVVFYNSGPEHAALVMGTIFNTAQQSIKIYAGSFSGEVSKNNVYVDSLYKFLKKGGSLEVLLQEEKLNQKEEPRIFDLFRFSEIINPGQIKVKKHPFKVRESGKGPDGEEIHFTVADGKMYRVEDNVQTFTAEGNFNNPNKANELTEMFDKIFKHTSAKEINL